MGEMGLVNRLERLGFPCENALRLVSVLLWLQRAVEMPDLLSEILSTEDGLFSTMVNEAGELLGFLSSPKPDPATFLSHSNLQTLVETRNGSLSIRSLFREKERVRAIVDKNFKLLSKAKGKARVGMGADGESSMRSDSIQSPSDHAAGRQSLDAGNAGQRCNQTLTKSYSPTFAEMRLCPHSGLNHAAPFFVPVSSVHRGPEEERCLYLTFSKGLPLNGPEIAMFFSDLCNNIAGEGQNPRAVETVYVHRGEADEMALFGKVVFCNPYLPKFFLGGQKEIKFTINGKELLCKRFLPKSVRNNIIGRHGESSQVRGPHGEFVFRGTSGFGTVSSGGQFQGMGRSSHFVIRPEHVATGWPVGQFQVPVGIRGAGAHVGPSHGGVAPGGVMVGLRQAGYYQLPVDLRRGSPVGPHQGGAAPGNVMIGPSPRGNYQIPIGIRVVGAQGALPQTGGPLRPVIYAQGALPQTGAPGGVVVGPSQRGYYQVPTGVRASVQGALPQGGAPRGFMVGPSQEEYHQVPIGLRGGGQGALPRGGGAPPGDVMVGPSQGGYYQIMGRGIPSDSYVGEGPGMIPGTKGTFQAAGRDGLTGSYAGIHGPS